MIDESSYACPFLLRESVAGRRVSDESARARGRVGRPLRQEIKEHRIVRRFFLCGRVRSVPSPAKPAGRRYLATTHAVGAKPRLLLSQCQGAVPSLGCKIVMRERGATVLPIVTMRLHRGAETRGSRHLDMLGTRVSSAATPGGKTDAPESSHSGVTASTVTRQTWRR